MNILFLPYFDANPYQKLLKEHLESTGVEVASASDPMPFRPFLHQIFLEKIDVLHVHWTHPYFLFGSKQRLYSIPFVRYFCAIAALFFLMQVYVASTYCEKVVWTLHNKHSHECRFLALDKWVGKELASISDEIQVWDDETERDALDYLEVDSEKITIIPHGNYIPLYENTEYKKANARDVLGLPEDSRIYLFFGAIKPYKGIPKLLQAFNECCQGDSYLLIAGNSKYSNLESQLRNAAQSTPNIQVELEYVPDERVPLYFASADFVVLPYERIFNSGSVLLAMSMGRAVIVPRKGSLLSVTPPENILYDNLPSALECAENVTAAEIRDIGQRNREIALRDHNWDMIAARTVEFYS